MFDSLWGWASGQLSADGCFHLKGFFTLSGCIYVCRPSPVAGPPTEMLSEGSQRRFHLCCFRVTGHRSTSKQKRRTRNASHSASQDLCHVLSRITAAPDIWRRHRRSPRVLSRSASAVERGWGGGCRTEMRMNKSVMLDLDEFQESTPYALVTEWIIQRYAGSRLICH